MLIRTFSWPVHVHVDIIAHVVLQAMTLNIKLAVEQICLKCIFTWSSFSVVSPSAVGEGNETCAFYMYLLFLSMKEYFNYHYQKPQYHLHLPRHVGQGRWPLPVLLFWK